MKVSSDKVESLLIDIKSDLNEFCACSEVVVLIENNVVYSLKAATLESYLEDNYDDEPRVYKDGIGA